MSKIKVGIFFGGSSREREISFAGGRTVYDNLDKGIFEAIPIFVDSFHNMVVLDWEYVYKGTIRDFYPPIDSIPKSKHDFQIYVESLGESKSKDLIKKIGTEIKIEDLNPLIDVAFLALHGSGGEDGRLQGLLEFINIPYTGSGIFPSAIGINKSIQKSWMKMAGFPLPHSFVIHKSEWNGNEKALFEKSKKEIGFPLVIRPANQGSSIGVSILKEEDFDAFGAAMNLAFFDWLITQKDWQTKNQEEKLQLIQSLSDIKEGLGFPLYVDDQKVLHPDELFELVETSLLLNEEVKLRSEQSESEVLLEAFIDGREFSCIVMRKEDGTVTALPPTEIIIGQEVYDYRSKYLPGLSRKLTPIDLKVEDIYKIQEQCKQLFELFRFHTYARIDGFFTSKEEVILNDPNTTSGMMPSSFFFHQAAELGLNPSQFLSYILRISLQERLEEGLAQEKCKALMYQIDHYLEHHGIGVDQRKKIGVVFGGYSSERHISVESGRNIFEKLSSSEKYKPIPLFLMGDVDDFQIYEIPISLVLKDNADDIKDKILNYAVHESVQKLRIENRDILNKYVGSDLLSKPNLVPLDTLKEKIDAVFIALHGRPGEDGNIQAKLDSLGIPYNGSRPESSSITIDKYATLKLLRSEGFITAAQGLYKREEYRANPSKFIDQMLSEFSFPFVLKPVDDGCSSAVAIIKSKSQLEFYLQGIFRKDDVDQSWREALELKQNEEFPSKPVVLAETLITAEGAEQFMEITGGLITHQTDQGIEYEIFEPSEALSSGEVLSLEEKFLAGQGQNITPARFGTSNLKYEQIAKVVKEDFRKAAMVLNVTGYARIDAFVRVYQDGKVETIIIEINSLPGMTPATCIFHQCAINDYKPFEFIDGILTFAMDSKIPNKIVH